MSPPHSHAVGKIFVLEGEASAKLLILEFEIDCPVCGRQRLQILGHHLRALRDTIRTAFDEYPELVSTEVKVSETLKFSGRTGGDPSVN